MEEYIFDGQPHALSSKLGYILIKIDPSKEGFDVKEEMFKLFRVYAEYLFACDKEKSINMMMSTFQYDLDLGECAEGASIIYRPPYTGGCLSQCGTLSLKFERSKEDTLGNP